MKQKLTFRQFQVAVELVLPALAVAAMVCEWIRPGSVNGFLWVCIAAMSGIQCIMLLRELERAEDSAMFWQKLCGRQNDDLLSPTLENRNLAGRLREIEANETDDLK